jgi:hypothetical protein
MELFIDAFGVAEDQVSAATKTRIFHSLGGSADWFKRMVIPHIRYWAAHVNGIAVTPSSLSASDPHKDAMHHIAKRPAIDYLMEQGLAILESWRACSAQSQSIRLSARSPASKLMKLHQAIIDGIWCLMQSVEIEAKDGSVWRLGETPLQIWFEQKGLENTRLRLIDVVNADIWREAIRVLLTKEIWGPTPSGRWLACSQAPLILWPLAGRDLQHTLCSMGHPEYSIEYLRRSLKQWGYTNPDCLSGDLFPWVRPDQKTFFGLRAAPRLIALVEGSQRSLSEMQSYTATRAA